jgi:hypothetical protein
MKTVGQEPREFFVSHLERYAFLLDATWARPFGSGDLFEEASLVIGEERCGRWSALREWTAVGVGG